MGCSHRRYAVRTSSPPRRRSTMVLGMAATPTRHFPRRRTSTARPPPRQAWCCHLPNTPLWSSSSTRYALPTAHELAQRLHEVQTLGTTSDYDDHLAVLEETAVDRARIAQLDELVRCATVLDSEDEEARWRRGPRLEGRSGRRSRPDNGVPAGRTTQLGVRIARGLAELPCRAGTGGRSGRRRHPRSSPERP